MTSSGRPRGDYLSPAITGFLVVKISHANLEMVETKTYMCIRLLLLDRQRATTGMSYAGTGYTVLR